MSKPPHFPLYVNDFVGDGKVEAMSTQEVGCYILFLCKAWREEPPGSIPNDDRVLARWARLTPDQWAECRTGVLAAFKLGNDNRYHQKRLREEYEKMMQYRQERIDSGKKGAKEKWLRHRSANGSPNGSAMREPMAKDGSSSSLSSSPSVQERESHGPGRRPADLPECLATASMIGVLEDDARQWFKDCSAAGWRRGDGTLFDNWVRQLTIHRDKLRESRSRTKPLTQAGEKGDEKPKFWQSKAEYDLVCEGIKEIEGRASKTAMDLIIEPRDKERYGKLRKRRMELKKALGLE